MSVPKLSSELTAVIVEVLQETRLKKELSKKKLAAATGVSRTAIILMEKGESIPSLGLAVGLAMNMGVSFSSVVSKAEKRLAKKLAEAKSQKATPAAKVALKKPRATGERKTIYVE